MAGPCERSTGFREFVEGRDVDLTNSRIRDVSFRDCRIVSLQSALLEHCQLDTCRLDITDLRLLLDSTVTLNCFTFDGLEMTPESFDAFLYLFTITRGNDKKRAAVRDLIDPLRLRMFEKLFPVMGTR